MAWKGANKAENPCLRKYKGWIINFLFEINHSILAIRLWYNNGVNLKPFLRRHGLVNTLLRKCSYCVTLSIHCYGKRLAKNTWTVIVNVNSQNNSFDEVFIEEVDTGCEWHAIWQLFLFEMFENCDTNKKVIHPNSSTILKTLFRYVWIGEYNENLLHHVASPF